eukprot:CAMPEP_0170543802 /NCGR_PEP_ID=MMETSP0211-20121228/2793_1 /TAXON_ID=311385 /ORGANISM="Pseudokeronopsis sp., Strain OXSARD2" /LENGTH=165 /DNA_ID=CAMNT_0010847273 /DNA_START=286 /DNA_END=784 /DNA_ORIENTATION=-
MGGLKINIEWSKKSGRYNPKDASDPLVAERTKNASTARELATLLRTVEAVGGGLRVAPEEEKSIEEMEGETIEEEREGPEASPAPEARSMRREGDSPDLALTQALEGRTSPEKGPRIDQGLRTSLETEREGPRAPSPERAQERSKAWRTLPSTMMKKSEEYAVPY